MKSTSSFKAKSMILSVLTGVGVVVTAALSAHCAKKDDSTRRPMQRVKTYLPAIASGAVTVGLVAANAKISSEEVAALTVACAGLTAKLSDYRDATVEHLGSSEEVDKIFARKQAERIVNNCDSEEASNLETFVDAYSGASFKATLDKVIDAEETLEKMYSDGDCVCWCDLFFLATGSRDAYESSLGPDLGWSKTAIEDIHDTSENSLPNLEFYNDLEEDGRWRIRYNYDPEMYFYEY